MVGSRRDVLGVLIVVLSALGSVVAYPELPSELAIHFDATGRPDAFVAAPVALAALPTLAAGLVVLFRVLPAIDPLGDNVERFQRYYDYLAVLTVGLVATVHGLVIAWNLGYEVPILRALAPMLAAFYYLVGIVVENARQNWIVGIRTPWTLSSEVVWNRTHERSGVLFKIAGLLALLAIPFPEAFVAVAVVPIVCVALVTSAYSYVLYRRVA